jgi:NAD-dependent deacetylase
MNIPTAILAKLQQSQRMVVVTGGGLSAESGVASFRQAMVGEWANYDVRDLATPQAFARSPKTVWQWYDSRRRQIASAQPNPAHHALVDLEQHVPEFLLVSLAIDGLHWQAGSRDIIELNGCVQRVRCVENGHLGDWDEEGSVPPRCPRCGSLFRPDVVLLGEGFARTHIMRARTAVEQCDVIVFVGELSTADPVAQFPFMARRAGATVITISREDSMFAVTADVHIRDTASTSIPHIVRVITSGAESV